jgi:hypothetical protein
MACTGGWQVCCCAADSQAVCPWAVRWCHPPDVINVASYRPLPSATQVGLWWAGCCQNTHASTALLVLVLHPCALLLGAAWSAAGWYAAS